MVIFNEQKAKGNPTSFEEIRLMMAFIWLCPEPERRQVHAWDTHMLSTASTGTTRKLAAKAHDTGEAPAAGKCKATSSKGIDDDLAALFG